MKKLTLHRSAIDLHVTAQGLEGRRNPILGVGPWQEKRGPRSQGPDGRPTRDDSPELEAGVLLGRSTEKFGVGRQWSIGLERDRVRESDGGRTSSPCRSDFVHVD